MWRFGFQRWRPKHLVLCWAVWYAWSPKTGGINNRSSEAIFREERRVEFHVFLSTCPVSRRWSLNEEPNHRSPSNASSAFLLGLETLGILSHECHESLHFHPSWAQKTNKRIILNCSQDLKRACYTTLKPKWRNFRVGGHLDVLLFSLDLKRAVASGEFSLGC